MTLRLADDADDAGIHPLAVFGRDPAQEGAPRRRSDQTAFGQIADGFMHGLHADAELQTQGTDRRQHLAVFIGRDPLTQKQSQIVIFVAEHFFPNV
ncbi:hypothetical protein SDC9_191862 [bioreactor metagenome]|uniref:Uncharacterized protein n=1 Tax=bioreactor metagenome TaxID=1076179 RepID=A0A645HZF6_9ZZZZ